MEVEVPAAAGGDGPSYLDQVYQAACASGEQAEVAANPDSIVDMDEMGGGNDRTVIGVRLSGSAADVPTRSASASNLPIATRSSELEPIVEQELDVAAAQSSELQSAEDELSSEPTEESERVVSPQGVTVDCAIAV